MWQDGVLILLISIFTALFGEGNDYLLILKFNSHKLSLNRVNMGYGVQKREIQEIESRSGKAMQKVYVDLKTI